MVLRKSHKNQSACTYSQKYGRSKILGHGSFGVVQKYEMKTLSSMNLFNWNLPRIIAIKMLHKDLQLTEPIKRLPVIKEINVHGFLKHPNIVKCYGYCIVDDAVSIALEYCDTDLGTCLKRSKSFSNKDTKRILWQLAIVLEFMKDNGIAHRDIKPGNVLLRCLDPFRIAISDFGMVKVMHTSSVTMTATGTAAYMAPEALEKGLQLDQDTSGDIGHAGDVYSFGVVAFQVATGILLPMAKNEEEVFQAFERNKGLVKDDDLASLIRSCLHWQPEKRPRKEELWDHSCFDDVYVPRPLRATEVILSSLLSKFMKNSSQFFTSGSVRGTNATHGINPTHISRY